MPLYVNDYLGDTMHLSTIHHGAYLLLLMHGWKNGGVVPSDDNSLASITRLPTKEWKKLRPIIEKFFCDDSGKLIQKRLNEEYAAAANGQYDRRKQAEHAASIRWDRERAKNASRSSVENPQAHARACANSNAQSMLEQCPSPSQSQFNAPLIPQGGTRAEVGGEGGGDGDGAFTAAWSAFSKWSEASTRFPLGLGHNHERVVKKLLESIDEQPTIFHGGSAVPQRLMVSLAVEYHITKPTQFESIAYACKCVAGTLDKWAKTGAPGAAPPKNLPDPTIGRAERERQQADADAKAERDIVEENERRRKLAGGVK